MKPPAPKGVVVIVTIKSRQMGADKKANTREAAHLSEVTALPLSPWDSLVMPPLGGVGAIAIVNISFEAAELVHCQAASTRIEGVNGL